MNKNKTINDDIKNKSIDELLIMLKQKHKELYEHRVNNSLNQLKDTSLIKKCRRDIARINTEITVKKTNNK